MKILVITDTAIKRDFLDEVLAQVGELYQRNTNIVPQYIVQDFAYGDYPVEQYWGGYYGISHAWLRAECAKAYKRYEEEIVGVVFAISSENWKLDDPAIVKDKPVWGWNHSNQMSGYGVQQVRIAQVAGHSRKRNLNNSIGTLFHEGMHDHDTFVFVNTGKLIEDIVKVPDWDNSVVHGQHPDYTYIRYKENQDALRAIGPALSEALAKRQELMETKYGLYKQMIQLLIYLRATLAAQRGDLPILPDNQCIHDCKIKQERSGVDTINSYAVQSRY